jgi:hypothetical protein
MVTTTARVLVQPDPGDLELARAPHAAASREER